MTPSPAGTDAEPAPTRPDDAPAVTDGRVLRARALRERRRIQLLAAARSVFAERGYHGTSLQDLLTEARVARGTFYQYFDSRRACFGAVLAGFVDTLRAAIAPVDVGAATPPRDQLIANLERVLAVLEADAGLARLLLHEARGSDPEFDELLEDFDARVLGFIKGSLTTGTRLGLVRPCDLELRATFVLGALKEAVSQTLLGRAALRPRAAVARELLDFTLRGVLTDAVVL
ncbi:MAG: TetR/AcrR family transcriptional regulator [Deltaproteobacteria bacterium HGW-Deltaproteobacteria-14]|jgi:AcrR family transcriptional regulator|nr:MAG: TetR/AcrR family transcriptional regulator [Deltaproteobacteria bacterium HGW-Deltaproteobacteria-14]